MPELQPLRADHADAVLRFELANRAWFASWVSGRGDDFFAHYADRHRVRLAEQESGEGAYYVLVDGGAVLGRFNLILSGDGVAELGYRMAESAAGRGLATAAVRELCGLASRAHGLRKITAATSSVNKASRRVLTKAGFRLVGPADPADLGGKPGERFELTLS